MNSGKQHYKRLPGTGKDANIFSFGSRTYTLWLGDDHILWVEREGYKENYRRFYFKDIQAFIVRRTYRREWATILLGFIALLFTSLSLAVAGEFNNLREAILPLAPVPALFWTAFVVNWLLGPTCHTQLQTSVQTHNLPSLYRIRTARRVINIVGPLIQQAQASIAPPASPPVGEIPKEPSAAAVSHANTVPPPILRAYNSRSHATLFSLLIADTIHTLVLFVYSNALISIIGAVLALAIFASIITALVQQADSDLPPRVKGLTFGALSYFLAAYVLGNTVQFVVIVTRFGDTLSQSSRDTLTTLSTLRPWESYPTLIFALLSIAAAGIIGSLGLLEMIRFKQSAAPPKPPPLPTQ